MLGGPVQPATSELRQHAESVPLPHIRSLWPGPYELSPPLRTQSNNHFAPATLKRKASQTPLPDEHAAKKQSKWTPEEDNRIIQLRGRRIKWDDIAKDLPGRSSISCRLRYQNYLEKRAIWDEEEKNKFAKCYERTGMSSSSQVPVIPASTPYGSTPSNAPQSMPQLHQVPPPMSQGPVPEMQSAIKRETENPNYTKTYHVREQKDKAAVFSLFEHETGRQGARGLNRISQHSAARSSKSIKREPEETGREATVPSATQMCEFTIQGSTKLEPDS
ncbi:hypothetical protein G6011_06796 [Alternaria panax]|uniref:Myb-like domain-containing protein n=1 Tax=Alternaria panax TaxID=48097 RepID=A0AAD4I8B9_9PLEO|nr:hypothetical protein G6011_06796 [Alternaria panax]